jgi:hypothetical protein
MTDGDRCARTWSRATAAMVCAVALGACGSSSKQATVASSASIASVRFSACMRSNGVPNFPDPGSSGTRIEASGESLSVNGVSVNAPAFAAARAKCDRYVPHGNATPAQTADQRRKDLQFAECMRAHGVPNFPDPKVSTGSNGNGVVDLRGAGLNFGAPAFKAAAQACGGGPKGPF